MNKNKQKFLPSWSLHSIEGAYNLTKEALGIGSSIEFCSIKLNKNNDPNGFMWWWGGGATPNIDGDDKNHNFSERYSFFFPFYYFEKQIC